MLSELAANAAADAVCALLDGGTLRIYDEKDNVLAELGFAAKAFGRAKGGVALSAPLTPDTNARAKGKPAWFAALTAGGQVVSDGTAGGPGSGEQLVLAADEILKGAEVFCKEFKYQQRV